MIKDVRIYMVSMKYAPGLFKEFTLIGNEFIKRNINVSYILSSAYSSQSVDKNNCYYIGSSTNKKEMILDSLLFFKRIQKFFEKKQKNSYDFYLFYNSHPVNPLFQLILKWRGNNKIVIFLHEPYKSFADLKKYGLFGGLFFSIVSLVQYISIKVSDEIVTLSPYGGYLFEKNFPNLCHKLTRSNLLMEDNHTSIPNTLKSREFFSFIGTVNKGKNIDDIIKLVNYCLFNNIRHHNFLIITSSNIEIQLKNLNRGWENILKIINHNHITDDEINGIIKKSYAVLILHKTASQSGVLPLAYKFKTPIIIRELNAFTQFFDKSGVILPYDFKTDHLLNACYEIKRDFFNYSTQAFQLYNNSFSQKNFEKYYCDLIEANK